MLGESTGSMTVSSVISAAAVVVVVSSAGTSVVVVSSPPPPAAVVVVSWTSPSPQAATIKDKIAAKTTQRNAAKRLMFLLCNGLRTLSRKSLSVHPLKK
jgi:hypothetical protein